MSLAPILGAAPVRSVDEALEIMRAIDARLPDDDGVKWFNRLYLRVTAAVRAAVGGAEFQDPVFLTTLDIIFANLYFSALSAALTDPAAAPPAWRPLFQARHSPGIAPIQFAVAGMNAHINRDLPDGIVESFLALGGDPLDDEIRERDFESVNGLLERVQEQVKGEFTTGKLDPLDRLAGDVDDAVAAWKVRSARSAAWTNAQVLWGLRGLPPLRDRFFRKLDSLVGLTGHGLLLPRQPAVRP
jgi:hypothetical protein